MILIFRLYREKEGTKCGTSSREPSNSVAVFLVLISEGLHPSLAMSSTSSLSFTVRRILDLPEYEDSEPSMNYIRSPSYQDWVKSDRNHYLCKYQLPPCKYLILLNMKNNCINIWDWSSCIRIFIYFLNSLSFKLHKTNNRLFKTVCHFKTKCSFF